MKKTSLEFLKRLMSAISPSGYELDAVRVFRKEAESFAAEVRTDVHGNTDVVVNPGGSPRVMLAGHYDEIGFIVTLIDPHGYLWVAPIGGWDAQIPQGQRVAIRTAKGVVPGIIGKVPIHVQKPDDRARVTPLADLWVDVGAKNRKEAEKMVSVGDPMVIDQGVAEMPNGRLAGRAFDDRAGAFVVLEAAPRTGGFCVTEAADGYLLDWGPNGFLDSEPATLRLVDELGLRDRLRAATDAAADRYLFLRGRLRPIPLKPGAFLRSDLLSWRAKLPRSLA